MEFRKNELINEVLLNFYKTFSLTLDTCDFVPDKFNYEIRKYLFKEMKKKFKEVNREYKKQNKVIAISNKRTKWLISNFSKLFFRSRKKELEKIDTKNLLSELESMESKMQFDSQVAEPDSEGNISSETS